MCDLGGYAGGASSLNRYDRPLRMRVKSINMRIVSAKNPKGTRQ
jgi:hypothetical protein